jgi:hypothetical protein
MVKFEVAMRVFVVSNAWTRTLRETPGPIMDWPTTVSWFHMNRTKVLVGPTV